MRARFVAADVEADCADRSTASSANGLRDNCWPSGNARAEYTEPVTYDELFDIARKLAVKKDRRPPRTAWASRARRAGGAGQVGESEEFARLRQENAQRKEDNMGLAMERDVLKPCMVLWVK